MRIFFQVSNVYGFDMIYQSQLCKIYEIVRVQDVRRHNCFYD